MPILRTDYPAERPPELYVALVVGEEVVVVLAIVDSGADRSLFPMEFGELLGLSIEDETLVEDETGCGAVGGAEFPTWSSTEPIVGQVLRLDENGELVGWGPIFDMDPSFARLDDEEDPSLLLGRNDFFAPFAITFALNEHGPSFELEYWVSTTPLDPEGHSA